MFGKGYRRPLDIQATLDSYKQARNMGASTYCKKVRDANPELKRDFAKLDRSLLQQVVTKRKKKK